MRDIKFRYWDPVYHDPVNGQMIYSEVKGLKWFFKRYQEAVDLHNNPTLMQFTGLQDKNGRDIYEGDLVRDNFNNVEEVLEMDGNGCFPFIQWPEYKCWNVSECEVIGNIYETTEMEEN